MLPVYTFSGLTIWYYYISSCSLPWGRLILSLLEFFSFWCLHIEADFYGLSLVHLAYVLLLLLFNSFFIDKLIKCYGYSLIILGDTVSQQIPQTYGSYTLSAFSSAMFPEL